jgi:hypothetical protein
LTVEAEPVAFPNCRKAATRRAFARQKAALVKQHPTLAKRFLEHAR